MKCPTFTIMVVSPSTFAANVKYSKYNKQYDQANTNHCVKNNKIFQKRSHSKNHSHKSSSSSIVCQLWDMARHSRKTCRRGLKTLASLTLSTYVKNSREDNRLLDFETSNHMTVVLEFLFESQEYLSKKSVIIRNRLGLLIFHIETIILKLN